MLCLTERKTTLSTLKISLYFDQIIVSEGKVLLMKKTSKKNYYYLDTENISIAGLIESLPVIDIKPNNQLILCFNKKVVYDVVNMLELKQRFEEVVIDEVAFSSLNALDFHIITSVGVLSSKNVAASIWILSKDKGYLPGVELLRKVYPSILFKLGPQNASDSENMFKNVLKQKISSSNVIKGPEANRYINELFKCYQNTQLTEDFTDQRIDINLKFRLSESFLSDLDNQHKILKKYSSDPYL